uniref:Superoxide dismutase [Cu-Zn] n=1 Tax=Macrobrachium rosenbergii TaxID=79674 RepID=A7UL77_MACRS|nr:copper/zinc superoxide dismutase [Macrobrachium rosenbergii]
MAKCLQVVCFVVGAICFAAVGAGFAVLFMNYSHDGSPNEEVHAECVLTQNPDEAGDVAGTIVFHHMRGSTTIHIEGNVTGLTPVLHGFHIHTYGVVGGDCGAAAAHYNPDGFVHGGPDAEIRHVGDLGNIESDEEGIAHVGIHDEIVSLYGDRAVVGRSVVVHAKEDDLGLGGDEGSLTTGNAGARLACCTIFLAPHDLEN